MQTLLRPCLLAPSLVLLAACGAEWGGRPGAGEPPGASPPEGMASTVWSFDDADAGGLPPGWSAGATNPRGAVATWAVEARDDAPSGPNVLVVTDTKDSRGSTYNVCRSEGARFRDGRIEVKVKAGTGREDQGGGPLWRVRDDSNYYVARWNPLEDNFRLYYVQDGRRVQLDGAEAKLDPSEWHTIRIEQRGDRIRGYLDGELLLEERDDTFPDAGGVGLWTKADAATLFDDLVVAPAP